MASNNAIINTFQFAANCFNDKGTRSNFNKSLQYFTRLASVELKEIDDKSVLAKDLAFAAGSINTARKISTLGSFIDVFLKIRHAKWNNQLEIAKSLSELLGGVFMLFDNIVILNRIKLTDILSTDGMVGKISMFAFWWSQLFGLIVEIINYQKMLKDARKNKPQTTEELMAHRNKVMWAYLGFVARIGNLTYSANGWQLSDRLMGAPLSERTCAWAGLISGLIGLTKGALAVNMKQ